MIHKLKKNIPIQKTNTKPNTNYWFCDICGKNYTKLGKYQHLKTEMHKRILHNMPAPPHRRLKNKEDYVENKQNHLFKGGTLIDDPIEETNLQAPLEPTKYIKIRPVPKPRRRPVPLPRLKKYK